MGEGMKETWKDIKGYEKYYQVSNLGKVRSKDRIEKYRNRKRKGRILKQQPNSQGYLRIELKVDGKSERFFVHRLVAESFCIKPEGTDVVNHLDSDYTNNKASNLEWTTLSGNMQHALKKGRLDRTSKWLKRQRKSLEKYKKPVIGRNIKTGNIVEFNSINEAGRNGFQASCICNCCKGIRQTHKGHIWQYKEES